MLDYPIFNIDYDKLDDLKIADIKYNPFILCVNRDDVKYEFLIKINKSSDKALLLGSGAYDPYKIELPLFNRNNWINDFDYNLIYYNDPTLYLDKIRIGWGYGTKDRYFLGEMAEIIIKLLSIINVKTKDAYFFGSSGGGFMSIMLATMCKGSTAIVNNTQTDISRYYKTIIIKLFEVVYGEFKEEYINENLWRISLIENMIKHKNTPKIYYLQNLAGEHDVYNHLIPFLEEVNKNGYKNWIELHLYYNLEEGHNPINKTDTINFINSIMNKNKEVDMT